MTKNAIAKRLKELDDVAYGNEIHTTPNLVFITIAKTLILIAHMIFNKTGKHNGGLK